MEQGIASRKRVCVVTGTRAEYHLLHPLIVALQKEPEFYVMLAVTGAHLSEQQGNTWRDIERDGIRIDIKIPILGDGDSESDINHAMSRAIDGFDTFFHENRPELVIILGDRYEMLSVAIVCMNMRIPIAHIHGGETTEGAVDESIRHAITKMSYLHFTSCEEYRKRVIQLGESPGRVFNVGALSIENIKKVKTMSREELSDSIDFDLSGEFAVCTYHPVTLEDASDGGDVRELFAALDAFPDLKILFTKANADRGGVLINQMIDEYVSLHPGRCTEVFSLGMERYLSALSLAALVVGNSSSGIMETPSFGVPTVNIGDRQKGRIRAENIIDCSVEEKTIIEAIQNALSDEFKSIANRAVNPYGDGYTSERIVSHMRDYFAQETGSLKKGFFDIGEEIYMPMARNDG